MQQKLAEQRTVQELSARLKCLETLTEASDRLVGLLSGRSEETQPIRDGIHALAEILQARCGVVTLFDARSGSCRVITTGQDADGRVTVVQYREECEGLEAASQGDQAACLDDVPPPGDGNTSLTLSLAHRGRTYGRLHLWDKTTGTPFTDADRVLATGFARTISLVLAHASELAERRRTEGELQLRTGQLQAIADATLSVLDKGDWKAASSRVLRAALSQTESEYGFVGTVDEGRTLRILTFDGVAWDSRQGCDVYEKALADYREHGYLEFTDLDNLFGAVITSGRSVLSNHASDEARAGRLPRGHPPLRSFLGTPMLAGGKVIGMIAVANRSGDFGDAERSRLEILARMASVLFDNYLREQRERDLREQLHLSSKLEAVGRLAGGIAHDFNNLLTTITGYSELLLEDIAETSPQRRSLQAIRKAAHRAAALTHQLLAFSRKQVLQPRVLDLNAVVSEVDTLIMRLIGENIQARTVLAPDLGRVKADPGQIEQILMNLVVNARDAMPAGGKLLIETANVDLDDACCRRHAAITAGPYVMLSVTDTGVGMDREIQSHIFEPFFTTKERGKGTGLGLATAYGIVKQSNGYIWVYSEPGHGTTFKLYFPRVDLPLDSSTARVSPGTVTGGSETILLVEDDGAVRELVAHVLRGAGYQVLESSHGADAVRAAAGHTGTIHLLLTDVILPDRNGPDLFRGLRSRHPGILALFMSGYTDHTVVDHGHLRAGVPFLQKPFTPSTLLCMVRETLDSPGGGEETSHHAPPGDAEADPA